MVNSQSVRFINPPNILKQKVGTGGIDTKLLDQSQSLIDNAEIDFAPYAQQFLDDITKCIEESEHTGSFNSVRDDITEAVMQLKGNGGMFRYQLLSDVADIALQFLETTDEFNPDSLKVLKAHENALQVIIKGQLKGTGGREGTALVQELHDMCQRYFKKHEKS